MWGEGVGSTCCGKVEEGLTLDGRKGNQGGQSGEQRPEGENSMYSGGQVWITKQVTVAGEKDVRDGTVRVEAGKGSGTRTQGTSCDTLRESSHFTSLPCI